MTFENLAKGLLEKKPLVGTTTPVERANVLVSLANNGFSVDEVCVELRSLYDNTEDDTLRKQLLDMIIKVHGLYKEEDKRETPKIIFNINAVPEKLNSMLCPPFSIPVGEVA